MRRGKLSENCQQREISICLWFRALSRAKKRKKQLVESSLNLIILTKQKQKCRYVSFYHFNAIRITKQWMHKMNLDIYTSFSCKLFASFPMLSSIYNRTKYGVWWGGINIIPLDIPISLLGKKCIVFSTCSMLNRIWQLKSQYELKHCWSLRILLLPGCCTIISCLFAAYKVFNDEFGTLNNKKSAVVWLFHQSVIPLGTLLNAHKDSNGR